MSSVTAVPLRAIPRAGLIMLWGGIAALVVAAIVLAWTGTAAQVAMAQPPEAFLAANAKRSGVVTLPSGVQYKVLKEGAGPKAQPQDVALVRYDGKFLNGETFDSTPPGSNPVPLPVGQMIPGFSEGLEQMNRGAKYRLWIPPKLGYGASGAPDPRTGEMKIPPNALLVFDVEMVDLAAAPMGMGVGGMDGMGHGGMGAPTGR